MLLSLIALSICFSEYSIPFLLYFWEFYKYILSLVTKILHLDFLADISDLISEYRQVYSAVVKKKKEL